MSTIAAKLRKLDRRLVLAAIAIVICYMPVIIEDARVFNSVTSGQFGCCGYVSENWLARPITYALVDEWTPPTWTRNATGTERWLTSDGIIDGNPKFWRIVRREPATVK